MNITVPAVNSVEVSAASPSQVNVSTATSFSATVTNKGPKGDTGATGATGPQGDPGQGLAAGGTTSQLLVKSSGDDYDTSWTSDLSVNSASVTNNINSFGSIVNLGGITTVGNLSAGSISGVSTATINTGNISALNSGQLSFSGTAAASIYHEDGIYDRLGVYSDGGILNVLDYNNDNIDDQFVIANHALTPLMVVNSTGNVGIGTASPAYRLDVSGGDISLPLGNYIRFGSQLGIKKVNIGAMHFYAGTNSTTGGFDFATWNGSSYDEGAFVIRNSGNVGIGTTTPSTKLTVVGNSYLKGDVAVGPQANAGAISGYTLSVRDTVPSIYLKDQTGVVGDGRLHVENNVFSIGVDPDNATTDAALRFETRGSERMRIDHDGNVGIGTTSPRGKLDARGRVDFSQDLRLRGTAALEDQGVVRFYVDNTNKLYIDTGNNGSDLFAIDGSGNVGIGTASPSTLLTLDTSDANAIRINRSGTQRILSDTSGNNAGFSFNSNTNAKWQIGAVGNDFLIENSNYLGDPTGNKRILIDSSGNVGIGTTSPSEALHVVGNVVVDSGNSNMFIGDSTTGDSITGQNNIALGNNAMRSATATSQYGVAIGAQAGRFGNQTHGMCIGFTAGYNGASSSSYVGSSAGKNAAGQRNVGIGYLSGGGASNGVQSLYGNVSIGYEAGRVLETAATAVGYQALTALTTGTGNTAVGYQAGDAATTGYDNTLLGYNSGGSIVGGYNNTGIGKDTLSTVTSGYSNTAVGLSAVAGGVANTGVGVYSLNSVSGIWNTALGMNAGYSLTTENHGTFVGGKSGRYTTGGNNTLVGYESGQGTSGTSTFSNTTAVGYQALTALTTGTGNTALGHQAGSLATTQSNSVLIGRLAGGSTTYVGNNVFIGNTAGNNWGSGDQVVAIGNNAAGTSASGQHGVFIGAQAGAQANGTDGTVAVGWSAGFTAGGYNNVLVGKMAGYGSGASTYANTVAVGYQAGTALTTGGSNVLIGYQAGSTLTTESNKLYIENSNSTTPLIYGEFDNDIVRVNGTLEVTEGITVDETGLASAGDYGKGSEVWYQGTGATTAGSLYYLNSSGDWANTDASAASTAKGMLAFAAGTDSDVDGMIIKGFVYLGTDAGGSVGDVVYLSETANLATTTAPTTSGAIVRVLGYKVATNVIWFNPSNDYFEVE